MSGPNGSVFRVVLSGQIVSSFHVLPGSGF